jgi:hypothetical protein
VTGIVDDQTTPRGKRVTHVSPQLARRASDSPMHVYEKRRFKAGL